jgi:hypothetical protein
MLKSSFLAFYTDYNVRGDSVRLGQDKEAEAEEKSFSHRVVNVLHRLSQEVVLTLTMISKEARQTS